MGEHKEFENGLFEILRREIGLFRPAFGIPEVLADDGSNWSVLVDISFPAYDTDDGHVAPQPVTMEFRLDKDDGSYFLITGEDSEHEITAASIFACAYFYSLQAALEVSPIDLILHCPECHVQHVDAPEAPLWGNKRIVPGTGWTNPPHRSHLCHHCGTVWRPADVPTNGVASIKTTGKADCRVTPALPQGALQTINAFLFAAPRRMLIVDGKETSCFVESDARQFAKKIAPSLPKPAALPQGVEDDWVAGLRQRLNGIGYTHRSNYVHQVIAMVTDSLSGMAIVPVMQRVTKAEDLIDSAFYFAGGRNGLVKLGRGEWMRKYAIGEHGGYAVVGPITMPDFEAMLAPHTATAAQEQESI